MGLLGLIFYKVIIYFGHSHGKDKIQPHVHFNLIHDNNERGTATSIDDMKLANKIKKGLRIK